MNKAEACFEEIASRLEHEYIVNSWIRGDGDKEIFLYLLKSLAAICKLSWEACNVDYRASQLSKYPPYCSLRDIKATLAGVDTSAKEYKDAEYALGLAEIMAELKGVI
jgi:hypothetical protein